MAFNFPDAPAEGAIFTDATSGAQYVYKSGVWMQSSAAQIKLTALPRNLLVNGAIQISQELPFVTSTSVTGTFIADQWGASFVGPSAANIAFFAGNVGAPYPKGILGTVAGSTAYTAIAAGNYAAINQPIEGQTFAAALNWGRAEAVPAVLAFDAYLNQASAAGTYAVALRSGNADRSIVFPFTLTAADVAASPKRVTLAVPAVTAGTFARDSTVGVQLWFTFMAGATWLAPSAGAWQSGNYIGLTGQSNLLGAINNAVYIGNIGLYADPQATGVAPPFQVPDYTEELARCQRYYMRDVTTGYIGTGYAPAASYTGYQDVQFPVSMRAVPTIAFVSMSNSNCGNPAMGNVSLNSFRYQYVSVGAGAFYTTFGYIANARL